MMELSTQDRIKNAATKIFTIKGLDGARMQDIADEARINKAMLHYYFKNKQHLFELIFEEKAKKIFTAIGMLTHDDIPFETRIKEFISTQIDIISEFPAMPLFVMLEARKNPALIQKMFKDIPLEQIRNGIQKAIDHEVKLGNIRPISLNELFMNLMSLSVYPILAEPVLKYVMNMTDKMYKEAINERKTIIYNLIISNLKVK